jgi:hypothetical protein
MSTLLKTALRLCEMGFAIHWCQPKAKIPVEAGWSTAPVMTIKQLEATYREGYNVGFRPGKFSVVDGYEIVVLDIDIKNGARAYAEEAYAVAASLVGGNFAPQVKSGSGYGRHCYLRMPRGTSPDKAATTLRESDIWIRDGAVCSPRSKEAKPAWLIELLSTGKNCILPPSIHPDSGKPYEWLCGKEWL